MDEWTLSYQGFDPEEEGLREALCTLGNGYFASRGTVSEARADGVHYPGTYLAGGYNRRTTSISGRIDYYMKRTSNGSTLSRVVHSWVLARSDRTQSWELFTKALESDIRDIQGGTTPEGIHLGAMAGTVELIQRCYSGIEPRGSVLWFNPRLPDALEELHMDIRFRGHFLALDITRQTLKVSSNRCREKPVRIGFQGEEHSLEAGGSLTFQIQNQV